MFASAPRQIIDLSHSLSVETPAFPGDPALEIRILDAATRPSAAGERHLNSSHLSMGLHCGTHMDAPFHFFQDGPTIDQVLLERCMGTTLLIRLPHDTRVIDEKDVAPYATQLQANARVVFNTGWHHQWGKRNYFSEHPVITGAAARVMVDCGVRLIGVDTPSVDRPPFEAHLAILGAGVLIVENLTNLDAIATDVFELIATPLKIRGRDGSPVRALALL